MVILVSGSTGFVGAAVVEHLQSLGHAVVRLVRGEARGGDVSWNPAAGRIDPLPDTLDAVVHLAGENILGRWTQRKKDAIYTSRVNGTRLLAETLARMERPPNVLVCASAIGFYGDCGDEPVTEAASPGDGFLSGVCRDWEAAAEPAAGAGIRVVHLRLGMVLAPHGGALGKMLVPFKLGLGGRLGTGRQWVSWITLADVVRIVAFALETESLVGPVNAVAPEPVRNRAFTARLAAALHRPAVIPLSAAVLTAAMGQCARETLLAGVRAKPEKLQSLNFQFTHPTLETALSEILSRQISQQSLP